MSQTEKQTDLVSVISYNLNEPASISRQVQLQSASGQLATNGNLSFAKPYELRDITWR
jgi:hypothetical protein